MKYEEILWLTVIATSYLKKVENIFLRYTQVYIYNKHSKSSHRPH